MSEPTGYPDLDNLLGIHGRLEHGAKLLIRGGPGAGKTTLALQILARQLQRSPRWTRNSSLALFGLYISLEQPPYAVIQYARKSFAANMAGICLDSEIPKTEHLQQDSWPDGTLHLLDRTSFLKEFHDKKEPQETDETARLLDDESRIAKQGLDLDDWFSSRLAASIQDSIPCPTNTEASDSEIWIVIDSITLLETLLQRDSYTSRNRNILDQVCSLVSNHFREALPSVKVIFVFTGEFHMGATWETGAAAESFLCDIEILLNPEPVVGQARTAARNVPASGYNIELHEHPAFKDGMSSIARTVVESRPFCRVVKCRLGKNQSRRCTYEIAPSIGLRFNPLFPGDGQVLLFAENPKQWLDWQEFLYGDAPYQYPALRHEIFERNSLQRIFSTQRKLANNPLSTDLHLASFDTYWIRWNIELQRRIVLRRLFEKHFHPISEQILLNRVVSLFDYAFSCFEVEGAAIQRRSQLMRVSASTLDISAANERCDLAKMEKDRAITRLLSQQDLSSRFDIKMIEGLLRIAEAKLKQSDGIFHTIAPAQVKLFGERRSCELAELHNRDQKRTELSHISVPYNANVSFLVYREDLLKGLNTSDWKYVTQEALRIAEATNKSLAGFVAKFSERLKAEWPEQEDRFSLDAPQPPHHSKQRAVETEGVDSLRRPANWEEVIALCENKNWDFAIETRTFDTFVCFFLEIFWGCGGALEINEAYDLANPVETATRLFQALLLLQRMFHTRVIPPGSTLDSSTFGLRYSDANDSIAHSNTTERTWAFSRQWYSTFIDILTANDSGKHRWRQKNLELNIMPLPVSSLNVGRGTSISCWGEWHLAVLRGSENDELAVDIINNLMSSQKISERALRCAALPTVEEFYRIYQNTPIFRLPERRDVRLPKTTYSQLRRDYFQCARTRTTIFDYRHCMREIHGILEYLHSTPTATEDEIGELLLDTLHHIHNLRDRELLLH